VLHAEERKPHSEKYWFFDFETKLDSKSKQHLVNYCVAQDFSGYEKMFYEHR